MSPTTNIEHKTLVDILIWVAQLGDNVQGASEKVQKIHEQTALYFRKVSSRELEALLNTGAPSKVNLIDNNAFICLPPIEKGDCFVPILCVEYDYSLVVPELHLRIALFLISEGDGDETLKAIGYRFETAHTRDRHHYCHLQHINKLGQRNRYTLPGVEWIPTEYPAFPIDAQDPIQLLVCMLVSLYDVDIIKNLEGKFKSLIRSNLEKMTLHKFIT